jgi:2,4-dienoyl-CoA reductase-like NADH-dependent reductase (Old Yellow Enzyme family)
MGYDLLMSPIEIGPLTLRNRVIFGAHNSLLGEGNRRFGEPGWYGQRMGQYAADRARGGVAATIVGQTAVHPTTAYQLPPNHPGAWTDESVQHFTDLSEQVHAHGAKAFVQLTHNGAVNQGASSKLPVWAPSAVSMFFEPPKPMDRDEIRELQRYHAICARNAVRGGFDGIEIQAAHGYLIHEFLSPKFNKRTDEYGGSADNRIRFLLETIEQVREMIGDETVAVGCRFAGDDNVFDGQLGPEDCGELAGLIEAAGLVDFFNVSAGTTTVGMVRTNYSPHLSATYAAAAVRRSVSHTPVFAVQRIITPEEAEGVLQRGEADAVTLIRALIADPEWVTKAQQGKPETIRRCTGSNQSCIGNLQIGAPISCVQNPAVGREDTLGLSTLMPATTQKRVVVVGGGPAGLEAAWVAAARGHRVTLLERSDRLGGMIRLAEKLPGRAELGNFADWRAEECQRRGVSIELGVHADARYIQALGADAIVVATGGRATASGSSSYHPMPVAGSDQDFVLDHVRALQVALSDEADTLGSRVVILDAVGHVEAIGLGELLAAQGREVHVVTPLASPIALDYETAGAILPRAVQAGVRWRPSTSLASIGARTVTLVDVLGGAEQLLADVDTVVIRTHGVPVDELYHELKAAGENVVRVGDAVAVRYCDRAIYDGHTAGRAI